MDSTSTKKLTVAEWLGTHRVEDDVEQLKRERDERLAAEADKPASPETTSDAR